MKEEKAAVSDGEHPEQVNQAGQALEPDTVYRDQRKRYPWWVKSVDEITTATDKSKVKPYDITKSTVNLANRFFNSENLEKMVETHAENGLIRYIGQEKAIELYRNKWDFMSSHIQKNTPGFTHEDYALYYAAYSIQYNFSFDFEELTDKSAFRTVYED